MAATWDGTDMRRMDGETVVVTGANSGIGLAAARRFAGGGARVVLAVRDEAKGQRAAAGITGDVEVRKLDLADLSSVRGFASGWDGPISVLANNAGVMAVPKGRTADGFELQFGTNHLGHFALTGLLLESITDRVVTVSSAAHRFGRIDLDDPNWERRRYRRWSAYGQSKLANLLFTLELERRLVAAGSPLRALAAHPGYAATNLQSHTGNPLQGAFMAIGNGLFAQSDDGGALPTLYASTADLPGGTYVGPSGVSESRGPATVVNRSAAAMDEDTALRLWARSTELTGVTFPI